MAEKIVVDIEFKTNVQKISKDLESVKDSLNDTNEKLGDIADTGKSTEGALKKIGKGFKGLGLAMKTLGIGLVIEAFKFLKDIGRSSKGYWWTDEDCNHTIETCILWIEDWNPRSSTCI